MSKLYVISKFKPHPGNLDQVKQLGVDLLNAVRANDPGTSGYEWYTNADESEFTVVEIYNSSEAALGHLGNIGAMLGQVLALGDFSAEVLGPASPELLKAVEGLSLKFYPNFMQGL